MLYLSSYLVLCFTLQLILLLQQIPSWWLFTLWGLLCVVLLWQRRRLYLPEDHPHYYYRKQVIALMFLSLCFLMGSYVYLSTHIKQASYSPMSALMEQEEWPEGVPLHITGYVDSPVEMDGNRVRLRLQVQTLEGLALDSQEVILLEHYVQREAERDAYLPLKRGYHWQGEVELRRPDQARNPGAFNYQDFLARQQIYFVGRVVGSNWDYHVHGTWKDALLDHLDTYREVWLEQVEQLFEEESAAIIQALTMGYRQGLAADLVEMYQQLGIIHLLAISGLHVGILFWGLYRLLLTLPLTKEKVYLLLFFCIPLYMYVTGGQVSVLRAGLMWMIALLILRLRWWKQALWGLYAAYILLLLYNPFYLYDIGFQLSFLVTFSLLTAYPTLDKALVHIPVPTFLRQLLAISIIADLSALPVLLYHFYQYSPLAIVTNLLLVPIYSLLLIPGAFILVLLSFLSKDIVLLFINLYEYSLDYLHQGLRIVHQLPFAVIFTGQPQWWWFVLYSLLFLLLLVCLERQRLLLAGANLVALIGSLAFLLLLPYLDKEATIMVLDVGQGEAIIMELPYREEVILIDTGGQARFEAEEWRQRNRQFEVGRDVLLPYLRYRGINKIDKVIITHGHFDHFGGMQGLLGNIVIKEVYRSPFPPQTEEEEKWLHTVQMQAIPIQSLRRGDHWSTTHSFFQVLYPQGQEGSVLEHIHQTNLVLWNQIYQSTFLWTGDVEVDGEAEMLALYSDIEVDVLNIAHHGSKTSTSERWLNQLKPRLGLLSLGRNNLYGHPHQEVMQRLEEQGIPIYRTDRDGGIMLKVSAEGLRLQPTLQ